MAGKKPARELPKFILRFSEGMRDRIKSEAEANNRSMTAEIALLLEEALAQRDRDEEAARFWKEERPRAEKMMEEYEREREAERLTEEELRRRANAVDQLREDFRRNQEILEKVQRLLESRNAS